MFAFEMYKWFAYFRLGLAVVPSYRRTIISHYCSVTRWHNGQSKPGIFYGVKHEFTRLPIHFISLPIYTAVAVILNDVKRFVDNIYKISKKNTEML